MGLPQLCTADNIEWKKKQVFRRKKLAQTTGSTDVEHKCD